MTSGRPELAGEASSCPGAWFFCPQSHSPSAYALLGSPTYGPAGPTLARACPRHSCRSVGSSATLRRAESCAWVSWSGGTLATRCVLRRTTSAWAATNGWSESTTPLPGHGGRGPSAEYRYSTGSVTPPSRSMPGDVANVDRNTTQRRHDCRLARSLSERRTGTVRGFSVLAREEAVVGAVVSRLQAAQNDVRAGCDVWFLEDDCVERGVVAEVKRGRYSPDGPVELGATIHRSDGRRPTWLPLPLIVPADLALTRRPARDDVVVVLRHWLWRGRVGVLRDEPASARRRVRVEVQTSVAADGTIAEVHEGWIVAMTPELPLGAVRRTPDRP